MFRLAYWRWNIRKKYQAITYNTKLCPKNERWFITIKIINQKEQRRKTQKVKSQKIINHAEKCSSNKVSLIKTYLKRIKQITITKVNRKKWSKNLIEAKNLS